MSETAVTRNSSWKKSKLWLVILLTFLLDQATKAAALAVLSEGDSVSLLPFFDLTLGFNTGASFGLFSGAMADRPIIMALITGSITAGIAIMAFRSRNLLERTGFALIAGGAAGNVIDRLAHGAVTDFLDFHWAKWHWPAFNFADVAIVVGALLAFSAALTFKRFKQSDDVVRD